ncbi:hypothetical protein RQP46_002936 [Phenoliferia psychrophenolica]
MSSTRPRRSNAASASAPPPTGPCLLHRLPAELVKNIVELSIEEEDLAPYPHQQRTFELAGQVCRLWHDLLAHPQAYVVTDVLMAQRLAEKLKRDGTGRSVRKLGIDYSGQVWIKGRVVPPVPAIAALLDECPRLLELILIGKYSKIASMMVSRLRNFTLLQRLELDINDGPREWWADTPFCELPQVFIRLATVLQGVAAPLPGTTLGLTTFNTSLTSTNLPVVSSIILASSSTLTTLHLGQFLAPDIAIAKVVAAFTPVAPNLVDFEWGPYTYPFLQNGYPSPGRDDIAPMPQLRTLETGSEGIACMLPAKALLALPSLERLIWNSSREFLLRPLMINAVIAFLTSPALRGLKYFQLRTDHSHTSWQSKESSKTKAAKKAASDRIVQQTRGTGIEVVLD